MGRFAGRNPRHSWQAGLIALGAGDRIEANGRGLLRYDEAGGADGCEVSEA
jgi:hypothetical protein